MADGGQKMSYIVLRHQVIEHVTGPPIHRVACGNQFLVVLHELSIPDDQLTVVPDLFEEVVQLPLCQFRALPDLSGDAVRAWCLVTFHPVYGCVKLFHRQTTALRRSSVLGLRTLSLLAPAP